jgi:hypothetical protein
VEIADAGAIDGARDLCFGDLVAIADMDGRVSRYRRPGHVTVGAVAHGPSPVPGHGVGLTVVLSGPTERLHPRRSADASIAGTLRRRAGSEGGRT